MFEFLGICLGLAIVLAVNTAAAFVVSIIWQCAGRWVDRWSARTRAATLFALRLMPPSLALVFVSLFFIPSYLSYEPRVGGEVVSAKLGAFAFVSILVLGFAVFSHF